ncbi:MAG TPA: hypothetical protein ENO06_01220, partial [Methanolinea sp.]|nr:hypothetical protein [Methanolinea sp.]
MQGCERRDDSRRWRGRTCTRREFNSKGDVTNMDLSDTQRDALRELGNIGAAHAATT